MPNDMLSMPSPFHIQVVFLNCFHFQINVSMFEDSVVI